MPFSLFVQPRSGELIGSGIDRAGDAIAGKLEQERDYASEAKAFKNHAKALNELMGDQSPYKNVDFDSLSNRDMAKMGSHAKDTVNMYTEWVKAQGEASYRNELAKSLQLSNDLIKKSLEQNPGSGYQPKTPEGQALAQTAGLTASVVQDIKGFGLESEAAQYKSDLEKVSGWQHAASQQMIKDMSTNDVRAGIAGFIGSLNPMKRLLPASQNAAILADTTPEMPKDVSDALARLHQTQTQNPAAADLFHQYIQAQSLPAAPFDVSALGQQNQGLQATSIKVGGRSGATEVLKPVK